MASALTALQNPNQCRPDTIAVAVQALRSWGIRTAADVIEAGQSHMRYLTFVAALIASLIASAAAEDTVIDDATIQYEYTF